jgi:hypothetical protein
MKPFVSGPAAHRHCERSEAIQYGTEFWIASSQLLLAMTGRVSPRLE